MGLSELRVQKTGNLGLLVIHCRVAPVSVGRRAMADGRMLTEGAVQDKFNYNQNTAIPKAIITVWHKTTMMS